MMHALLSVILLPLSTADIEAELQSLPANFKSWIRVKDGAPQPHEPLAESSALPPCHLNTLRWKLLTRKLRSEVMVDGG
jgi:hypothetical protein